MKKYHRANEGYYPREEKTNTKNAIQLHLFLSRVDGKIHVAVDGNYLDINEFGIDPEKFHLLSSEIDKAIQKTIGSCV